MRQVLVLLVLLGCSRRVQASSDAGVEVADATTPPTPNALPVDAIDPPMSVKSADGVSVTFVGANGSNGVPATKSSPGASSGVGIVFRIDNVTGEERRIVGEMDAQAVTPGGLSGDMVQDPKILKQQCMGIAPPHGRFVCSLIYNFGSAGSEVPRELRVRMAGAWFHVAVTVKTPDAGP